MEIPRDPHKVPDYSDLERYLSPIEERPLTSKNIQFAVGLALFSHNALKVQRDLTRSQIENIPLQIGAMEAQLTSELQISRSINLQDLLNGNLIDFHLIEKETAKDILYGLFSSMAEEHLRENMDIEQKLNHVCSLLQHPHIKNPQQLLERIWVVKHASRIDATLNAPENN